MIFKIKTMSGTEVILTEDELGSFLDKAKNGGLIATKYGIVNTASIDSIIPHKEKNAEVREMMKYRKTKEEAESEVLGVSLFAKLLSEKKKILSDSQKTEIQEESAKEERNN